MIHSLYILNKAGGLMYHQEYSGVLNKLPINDYLVFAGTIHGVHAIASKLTPEQIKTPGSWAPKATSSRTPLSTPKTGPPAELETVHETGLDNLVTNFSHPLNTTVANSGLLNSSISYTKLNTNYFYMSTNVTGLNIVETAHFNIFIFQTLSGLKFILIASPHIHEKEGEEEEKSLNKDFQVAEQFLRNVYVLYSDYVMKNPFYSLDMPIKADLFETKVKELVDNF